MCCSNNNHSRQIESTKKAKINDLERINFVVRDGTFPNLSNRASSVLALFIALVKLGYIGISAPIAAIEQAIERSGYHLSGRTLYRALSELQLLGFITRKKCRIGHDKFETHICFIQNRFEFWTRRNVPKLPTSSHISPCLPNCQESPGTKIYTVVNSSNSSNKSKEPRARASRFKNWIDPILYTLLIVTKKDRDRKLVIARARLEIESKREGIVPAGCSGVDWDRPSWQEMPFGIRESICRREILPLLRNRETLMPSEGEGMEIIIEQLNQNIHSAVPECRDFRPIESLQPQLHRPIVLERSELEILSAAADRARRRTGGIS